MKAIFEDETTELTVGNKDQKLTFEITFEGHSYENELDLHEAYKLQSWIGKCIAEIEEKERQKLPLWKRIL